MTDEQPSNPFTSADQPTLRGLLDAIESDEDLALQRRRNVCSSIRTIAKLMRRDLGYLPAHLKYYRDFFAELHPERCGLSGFHRIRHYGLFANGGRVANIARARELLGVVTPEAEPAEGNDDDVTVFPQPCPCCGGRMIVVETFERGAQPRAPPTTSDRVDAS